MDTNQPISQNPAPQNKIFLGTAGLFGLALIIICGILIYLSIPISPPSSPTATNSLAPATSNSISQRRKAEELLTQYMKDTLKPEFVPPPGKSAQSGNTFSYSFVIKNIAIAATLSYQENTNTVSQMEILIDAANTKDDKVSASLANSLMSSYFSNPLSVTSCKEGTILSYCESFGEKQEGKKGFGISFINRGGGSAKSIFTCFIPKESDLFPTKTSCTVF